jgi:L-rhamnose mutarotase
MKRYGMVIGVRSDEIAQYSALHAAAWPAVLRMIKECNIQNYSIYLRQLDDGNHYLFGYLEYVGHDFATDMAKMAADPVTQRWWELCKPMQTPLASRAPDEWWAMMEEVFHCD